MPPFAELLLADGLEVGGQEVPSALTVSLYDCFVQFSSPEELAEARVSSLNVLIHPSSSPLLFVSIATTADAHVQ